MSSRKTLKTMSADELAERAERIRRLNPYTYAQTQSYRATMAALRRAQHG